MDIKYETIKNGYITKEQAIAIAGCDRNLKDSIFNEYKDKKNIILGFISFSEFDVGLLKISTDYAWHVKVKKGIWGGQMHSDKEHLFLDGGFDESSDISCYIMCNSGEYYYHDLINNEDISKPDMNEYKKYISNKSIYF